MKTKTETLQWAIGFVVLFCLAWVGCKKYDLRSRFIRPHGSMPVGVRFDITLDNEYRVAYSRRFGCLLSDDGDSITKRIIAVKKMVALVVPEGSTDSSEAVLVRVPILDTVRSLLTVRSEVYFFDEKYIGRSFVVRKLKLVDDKDSTLFATPIKTGTGSSTESTSTGQTYLDSLVVKEYRLPLSFRLPVSDTFLVVLPMRVTFAGKKVHQWLTPVSLGYTNMDWTTDSPAWYIPPPAQDVAQNASTASSACQLPSSP